MNESRRRIKGLGEVSLRVQNLEVMQKFYEDVVGLEVLRRDASFVFFKVAEGYGGHTQNLALFAAADRDFLGTRSPHLSPDQSTLHHIALNISLDDYEAERKRLVGLGLKVQASSVRSSLNTQETDRRTEERSATLSATTALGPQV